MIETILGLIGTSTWLSALGAALWGVSSIILSPCHLTSIPLLVGFLGRTEGQTLTSRALAAWVPAGVSVSLVIVAGVSLAAGRILGDLWGLGPWLMIVFLIVAGLVLLDAVELPSLGGLRPEQARGGVAGAIVAGGFLGVTLGPRTFGFFAPLLAVGAGSAPWALKVATTGAFVATHLLATFTAGVLGARLGGCLSRAGRSARVARWIVGLAAIGLAVEMIITGP